jgi:hypothetical protein
MNWLNQSEFAKLVGVSRAAISKAVKRGLVVKDPSQGIDVDHPANIEYRNSQHDSRTRRKDSERKPKKPKRSEIKPEKVENLPPASVKAIPDEISEQMSPGQQMEMYENINLNGPDHLITKLDADRLKTIETAREKQIKRLEARGKLIDRDFVASIFNTIYKIDTGELRPLGDKLAPELAAICDVDDNETIQRMNEHVEKTIYKSLEHIRRRINNALEEIKAEAIEDE